MSSKFNFFVILSVLTLALVFRLSTALSLSKPQVNREIKLTGKVTSEPVIYGQSQYFSLENYRVRAKVFPKFHYGDMLEITGTPNEDLLIKYPEITKLGKEKSLVSAILDVRRVLIEKATQIWPQPESSLLTGVILGQDTIPAGFRQALINTGTIHIVVVSGQNVAMLAGFITLAFGKFFKRRTVSLLVILSVIFYTILTGFQPPTVRAAVMGSLTFLAKLTGRENWGFWALATAAVTMLFFAPKLLFDISFQLSFAATFGILFAEPAVAYLFKNFPKIIRESQSVTLSAWAFTAPIIAFYFGQLTPITPVSNLLVLPTVPILMIAGAVSLTVSFINLFLARISAIFPYILAAYFTFITENLAKIPFATFELSKVNVFLILAFYVFLILIVLWARQFYLAKKGKFNEKYQDY